MKQESNVKNHGNKFTTKNYFIYLLKVMYLRSLHFGF